MNIRIICYNQNERKMQTKLAVNILNGVQNYFHYILEFSENDVCDEENICWQEFCKNNNIENPNEYIIYITEKHFTDNWFSHENHNFSIISTNDWEVRFAPPSLKAYLAYQIAQSSINFVADLSEDMVMRMAHERAEGCMFDFCYQKSDIKFGMIAGNICPQCQGVLSKYGVQQAAVKAIERILQYIRSEAIGKPIALDENKAFIVMRYSEKDENAHAFKYGIKPALKELKIDCIKADDNLISEQILQNVKNGIERSRFIIIKVDTNNLNVYFELGLAMGLKKDILLISENNQIQNLPTDLSNWTCLTYPRGDYETLKTNISNYFKHNYYY